MDAETAAAAAAAAGDDRGIAAAGQRPYTVAVPLLCIGLAQDEPSGTYAVCWQELGMVLNTQVGQSEADCRCSACWNLGVGAVVASVACLCLAATAFVPHQAVC